MQTELRHIGCITCDSLPQQPSFFAGRLLLSWYSSYLSNCFSFHFWRCCSVAPTVRFSSGALNGREDFFDEAWCMLDKHVAFPCYFIAFLKVTSRLLPVKRQTSSSGRPPILQIGHLSDRMLVTMNLKESFPPAKPLFAAKLRHFAIVSPSSLGRAVYAPVLCKRGSASFSKHPRVSFFLSSFLSFREDLTRFASRFVTMPSFLL